MAKEQGRWWSLTYKNSKNKKKSIKVVRADTLNEAMLLACPRRTEKLIKHQELKGVQRSVEAWRNRKINLSELYEALGNTGKLLKSSVPFDRALMLQIYKTSSIQLRYYIAKVVERIREGDRISDAFRRYPQVADEKLVALIEAGEESGQLEGIFEQIRVDYKKQKALTNKLKTASIYPAAIIILCAVIVVVFSYTLIPQMANIYKQFGSELPVSTQITLVISNIIRGYPVVVLMGAILMVYLWQKRGKAWKWRPVRVLVYKLPRLGPFMAKADFVLGVKNLAVMLKSGIDFNVAMKMSRTIMNNPPVTDAWDAINKSIGEGQSLTDAFEYNCDDLGPDGRVLSAVVRNGEEGSNLDEALYECTLDWEEDLSKSSEDAQKLVEPIMLFTVAMVVGGLLISIYFPLVNVGKAFMGSDVTSPSAQVEQTTTLP